MEAGTVLQAASEDEMIPAAQQGAFFLFPPLDSVGSASETRRVDGSRVPTPGEHTPKLPGADSDAPSPQRARTTSQDAKGEGDNECRARHGFVGWGRVGNSAATRGDFGHALLFPVSDWPAYNVLLGMHGPGPHLKHRTFAKANLQNLQAEHSFFRQNSPFVRSRYEVRKLPGRRFRAHSNLSRKIGLRLGPRASGGATNNMTSVERTPPAMQRTSFRELMVFPQAQVKIEQPPTTGADAALRYPRTGYQGAVIAMTRCDAGTYSLARFVGTVAEVHTAKVG